jgi:TP901 family phage tail tape measure protein
VTDALQVLRFVTQLDDSGARNLQNSMNSLESGANRLGGIVGTVFKDAAIGIAGAFTAVTAGIGLAVHAATDFQTAMLRVGTLTGSSAQQLQDYNKQILDLSTRMPASAKELADGLYFVVSAGFKGADAMSVLETSAKASAAGLGDVKTVADAVTSVLNAYGKGAGDASRVTDVLARAVTDGKVAADTFAPALGRVLPLAAATGVSFEEVAASLAVMTRSGLDAAEAATSFRATLAALENPTKRTQEALAALGLTAEDVRDSIAKNGYSETLRAIYERANEDTDKFSKTLSEGLNVPIDIIGNLIPNIRGLTGALTEAGDQNYKTTAAILADLKNSSGATEDAYKKAQETVGIQLKEFQNNIRRGLVLIGDEFLPGSVNILKAVNSRLPDIVNGVKSIFVPIAKDFGDFFQNLGGVAGGALTKIQDSISRAFGSTGVGTGSNNPLRSLLKGIEDGITEVASTVTKFLTGPLSQFNSGWSSTKSALDFVLNDGLRPFIAWITNTAGPALANFFSNDVRKVLEEVLTKFGDLFNFFKQNVAPPLFDAIKSFIAFVSDHKEILGGLAIAISAVVAGFQLLGPVVAVINAAPIIAVLGAVTLLATGIIELVKHWDEWKAAIVREEPELVTILGDFKLLAETVGTVLVAGFRYLGSVIGPALNAFKENETAVKVVVGLLATLGTILTAAAVGWAVMAAATVAYTATMALATAAVVAFNFVLAATPIGLITLAIAGLAVGLVELVKHWDQVSAAVEQALGYMRDRITDFGEWLKSHLAEIATVAAIAFTGPFAPLVAFATNGFGMRDATIKAFHDAKTWLYNIGKDIVDGLWTGAKDAVADDNPFVYIKDRIVEGWKTAFNSHSPSLVMKPIGSDILSGAIQGMIENIQYAISSTTTISNQIIGALGGPPQQDKAKAAGVSLIASFTSGISSNQAILDDQIKTVQTKVSTAIGPNTLAEVVQQGRDFDFSFVKGMLEKQPAIADGVKTTFGGISQDALLATSKLSYESGKQFVESYIDSIKKTTPQLADELQSLVKTADDFLTAHPSQQGVQWGIDLMNKIKSSIEEHKQTVTDSFAEIFDEVKNFDFSGTLQEQEQRGFQLIQQLVAGTEQAAPNLYKSLKDQSDKTGLIVEDPGPDGRWIKTGFNSMISLIQGLEQAYPQLTGPLDDLVEAFRQKGDAAGQAYAAAAVTQMRAVLNTGVGSALGALGTAFGGLSNDQQNQLLKTQRTGGVFQDANGGYINSQGQKVDASGKPIVTPGLTLPDRGAPSAGTSGSGSGSAGASPGAGATLAWVMPFSGSYPVTQGYGPTNEPLEPIVNGVHFHQGIDFGVPEGTQVVSATQGKVTAAGLNAAGVGYGNAIIVDLGNGTQVLYGHLSEIGVSVGQTVASGTVIGYSGNTGASTGPHLHFAVEQNGQFIDPTGLLNGTSTLSSTGVAGTGIAKPDALTGIPADILGWWVQYGQQHGMSQAQVLAAARATIAISHYESGLQASVNPNGGATGPFQLYGPTLAAAKAGNFDPFSAASSLSFFAANGDLSVGMGAYQQWLAAHPGDEAGAVYAWEQAMERASPSEYAARGGLEGFKPSFNLAQGLLTGQALPSGVNVKPLTPHEQAMQQQLLSLNSQLPGNVLGAIAGNDLTSTIPLDKTILAVIKQAQDAARGGSEDLGKLVSQSLADGITKTGQLPSEAYIRAIGRALENAGDAAHGGSLKTAQMLSQTLADGITATGAYPSEALVTTLGAAFRRVTDITHGGSEQLGTLLNQTVGDAIKNTGSYPSEAFVNTMSSMLLHAQAIGGEKGKALAEGLNSLIADTIKQTGNLPSDAFVAAIADMGIRGEKEAAGSGSEIATVFRDAYLSVLNTTGAELTPAMLENADGNLKKGGEKLVADFTASFGDLINNTGITPTDSFVALWTKIETILGDKTHDMTGRLATVFTGDLKDAFNTTREWPSDALVEAIGTMLIRASDTAHGGSVQLATTINSTIAQTITDTQELPTAELVNVIGNALIQANKIGGTQATQLGARINTLIAQEFQRTGDLPSAALIQVYSNAFITAARTGSTFAPQVAQFVVDQFRSTGQLASDALVTTMLHGMDRLKDISVEGGSNAAQWFYNAIDTATNILGAPVSDKFASSIEAGIEDLNRRFPLQAKALISTFTNAIIQEVRDTGGEVTDAFINLMEEAIAVTGDKLIGGTQHFASQIAEVIRDYVYAEGGISDTLSNTINSAIQTAMDAGANAGQIGYLIDNILAVAITHNGNIPQDALDALISDATGKATAAAQQIYDTIANSYNQQQDAILQQQQQAAGVIPPLPPGVSIVGGPTNTSPTWGANAAAQQTSATATTQQQGIQVLDSLALILKSLGLVDNNTNRAALQTELAAKGITADQFIQRSVAAQQKEDLGKIHSAVLAGTNSVAGLQEDMRRGNELLQQAENNLQKQPEAMDKLQSLIDAGNKLQGENGSELVSKSNDLRTELQNISKGIDPATNAQEASRNLAELKAIVAKTPDAAKLMPILDQVQALLGPVARAAPETATYTKTSADIMSEWIKLIYENTFQTMAAIQIGVLGALNKIGNILVGGIKVFAQTGGNAPVRAFATGGDIFEPVVGRGTYSGAQYLIGEAGWEHVTPGTQINHTQQQTTTTEMHFHDGAFRIDAKSVKDFNDIVTLVQEFPQRVKAQGSRLVH